MEVYSMNAKELYLSKPWLKFYPEKVPHEIEIIEKSVPQAFDDAVAKWGKKKNAMIFYGAKMNFVELKEHVDRFATALWDLGVRKGDRVALLMVNCPQFVITFMACARIGAIMTPISPVYVSPEIKHQLEDSGTETVVCLDILYDRIERTGVKLKNVILTSIAEYLPRAMKIMGQSVLRGVYQRMSVPTAQVYEREGIYRWENLMKKYKPEPPKVDIDPREDLLVLMYSGGTTGLPKGVMITHYYVIAARTQMDKFTYYLEPGKETLLAYQPFYHIAGLGECILNAIINGFTMVIFATPDMDKILSAIEDYEVSYVTGSPAFYEALRDYEKTDRVDWKAIKALNCGADALLDDTALGWERRTGTKLHDHWGMTEFTAAFGNPLGKQRLGSIGIPTPNIRAAIIDPDTMEFIPPGEIGELIVWGPHIMKGYWNNPAETKLVIVEIDGEPWFRTGDLVRMDEDGYFYFYDRKRDMIKYKGYSVFAREIEEVLTAHPHIKDAAVIGVNNPKVGQDIKALIVLESESRGKISEDDVYKYCAENLAHYKCPKIIEFRGEVPKTDVGKVSRRELREEAEEEL